MFSDESLVDNLIIKDDYNNKNSIFDSIPHNIIFFYGIGIVTGFIFKSILDKGNFDPVLNNIGLTRQK
jgi:hypothetical protein